MRLPFTMNLQCPLLIILAVTEIVTTLKDVSITIPKAIRRGDNAILFCHYNLEGATLYTVKWYKGKREFFRYTPKENPATKVFPVPGIAVDRTMSNSSYLTLLQVELIIAGKYSCEVSADAPSFDTMVVSSELEVVEVPTFKPTITNINQKYRIGDILNVNCTSDSAKPATNLTWLINDYQVDSTHVKQYGTTKDNKTNLETTTLGLIFLITHKHFRNGRFKITCLSRLYDIYQETNDKYIEEDNPQVLLASASPVGLNVNLHHPYDQVPSSLHDSDNNEQSDAYMTGGNDMSSAPRLNSLRRANTIFIVLGNIFHNYGVYLLLML